MFIIITITLHHLRFNLHDVNIIESNNNLTSSLHIETQALHTSFAYLSVYNLMIHCNKIVQSITSIVGLCFVLQMNYSYRFSDAICSNKFRLYLDDLTNDNIYTSFIDNQLTVDHRLVLLSWRKLNSIEMNNWCSNQSILVSAISENPFHFSSTYQRRT